MIENKETRAFIRNSKFIYNQISEIVKLIKLDLNSEHIVTQGLALWLSEHIVILSGSLIDQISELDEEKRIYIKQKMLEILETLKLH